MVIDEIVQVAVAPPDSLEEDLIDRVAAIVDKDRQSTRILLAGKIPKIIASYYAVQMAEQTAQNLRALGLVVFVCQDSELRKPLHVYRAHTLEFEEQAVVFRDRSGQEKRMESTDTFLIIKGRMQTRTEKEVTTTKMKFNVPATLLTGGIPIWGKVKEKTKDQSVETQGFVRLYDRASAEPSMEILQYEFDYSFLGATARENLDTTVSELRDTFPQAIFDDRLTAPFAIDITSTAPQDRVEIDCKLIYLYHRAVSNPGSSSYVNHAYPAVVVPYRLIFYCNWLDGLDKLNTGKAEEAPQRLCRDGREG